jgi:predicted transcriptional regulator
LSEDRFELEMVERQPEILDMNKSMFELQAEFFKAMGNTVRLQLLYALRKRPLTVGEICQTINVAQTTVLHQLTILRGAGFVVS